MSEKLQKVLARAGLGSRRQIEQWIKEGRVRVNGTIAQLGDRVIAENAAIQVDEYALPQRLMQTKKIRVLLYHKPPGEICTRRDPEGRATVFDRLPVLRNARWISVGRLDLQTAGLLLLTNDGELAHQLMHPSAQLLREYAVRVFGEVDTAMLRRLRRGVMLDDGLARFHTITDAGGEGKNHWYHVTLYEGRNREVRRLWESQGVQVSRLLRVRFGPFSLPPQLKMGTWQELSEMEVAGLQKILNKDQYTKQPDR